MSLNVEEINNQISTSPYESEDESSDFEEQQLHSESSSTFYEESIKEGQAKKDLSKLKHQNSFDLKLEEEKAANKPAKEELVIENLEQSSFQGSGLGLGDMGKSFGKLEITTPMNIKSLHTVSPGIFSAKKDYSVSNLDTADQILSQTKGMSNTNKSDIKKSKFSFGCQWLSSLKMLVTKSRSYRYNRID